MTRDEVVFDRGRVALPADSLIVHCAASGLAYPPLVPIWAPDMIRLQTVRAGFPCFGAALVGYVEATRDEDRERNRLCPPNTLPDDFTSWARMQVRGALTTRVQSSDPDIARWADGCALNPARIDDAQRATPAVTSAAARLAAHVDEGLAQLAALAHEPLATVAGTS